MSRNSSRDVSGIEAKKIFYKHGHSRDGLPVFYFVARRMDSGADDFTSLMLVILRQLREEFTGPYMLVVDSLHASEKNDIPAGYLARLHHLLPQGARFLVFSLLLSA